MCWWARRLLPDLPGCGPLSILFSSGGNGRDTQSYSMDVNAGGIRPQPLVFRIWLVSYGMYSRRFPASLRDRLETDFSSSFVPSLARWNLIIITNPSLKRPARDKDAE